MLMRSLCKQKPVADAAGTSAQKLSSASAQLLYKREMFWTAAAVGEGEMKKKHGSAD